MGKPNIIVICSDQHHPAMTGYRGHPWVQTPHLDRLAADGAYFTRAYCNSPVCTPSRMSFITGKYAHQIGSWFIGCPLDPAEMTWARRLDRAGIAATMLGKMDFCGNYQDGGFTDCKIIERREAFDPYPLVFPLDSRLEGYKRPDKRRHLEQAGIREPGACGGHYDRLGYYEHDRTITKWAMDYLRERGRERRERERRNVEENKPWALYVGLLYPHWPFKVPQPYFDMYYPDRISLPHDARFPNPDLHPQVGHFQRALDLGEVGEETMRKAIAAYSGMITCMDDMVGSIIAELQAQGLYDDTYIVYMSDHGESLGEHGLFYKQCSYEGSVGVPLIVKGPGLPAGGRVDAPVTLVDLYPTIMDMAGLDAEPSLPGVSWLPLIRGERHERPDYAFAEYHGNFFKQDWYMLVQGDFKYTYYVNDRPSLYNVKEDPGECVDLAANPQYAGVLRMFEAQLRAIVDPEAVSHRAKRDLGLIGRNGEDYTLTMHVRELGEYIRDTTIRNEAGM